MNDIKASLTRKLGPLPAWAWLGILAVAVYIYRRRMGGATTQQGTATDTASIGPYGEDWYPQQGGSSGSSGGNGGAPTFTVNPPGGGKTKGKRDKKKKPQHTGKSTDKKSVGHAITTTLGRGKGSKGDDNNKSNKLGSAKARTTANQHRGKQGDATTRGGNWSGARSNSHQNNPRSKANHGASRGNAGHRRKGP